MALKNEAARLLLRARRSARLSQSELARLAGMPHSVLSAYERGRRDPGTRTLARLIEAAGYRLALTSAPVDLERSARRLVDVLSIVDAIPRKRRGALEYPSLVHLPS